MVAANVDVVFLVTSLDHDFSARRMERYLIAARESGARPVVVLNKADACAEVARRRAEAETVAAGAEVIVTSAFDRAALEPLRAHLAPAGRSRCSGSSGVGKSTIINRLHRPRGDEDEGGPGGRFEGAPHDDAPRAAARSRRRAPARHAGDARAVALVAGSGRRRGELPRRRGVADRAASATAATPRSRGARSARPSPDRLASYHKMQREVRSLEIRSDTLASIAEKGKWKAIHKSMRHPRSTIFLEREGGGGGGGGEKKKKKKKKKKKTGNVDDWEPAARRRGSPKICHRYASLALALTLLLSRSAPARAGGRGVAEVLPPALAWSGASRDLGGPGRPLGDAERAKGVPAHAALRRDGRLAPPAGAGGPRAGAGLASARAREGRDVWMVVASPRGVHREAP